MAADPRQKISGFECPQFLMLCSHVFLGHLTFDILVYKSPAQKGVRRRRHVEIAYHISIMLASTSNAARRFWLGFVFFFKSQKNNELPGVRLVPFWRYETSWAFDKHRAVSRHRPGPSSAVLARKLVRFLRATVCQTAAT